MPTRRLSRQRAIQVLYQADIRGLEVERALHDWYETLWDSEDSENGDQPVEGRGPRDQFMEELARGATRNRATIDAMIEKHAQNWRIERMGVVDRNILRIAVYEMTELPTPHPVVIDEAVDLARQFSGPDAGRFVNGLLDAVRKTVEKDEQAPPSSPPQT